MSDAWDCLSCGAHAQTKPYCDNCGAARPVEGGDDSALSMMLGLVCENCDAYNDPGVSVCVSCGKPLPVGDGDGNGDGETVLDEPVEAPAPPAPSASPPTASPPIESPPIASPPIASPPIASPPIASTAQRFATPLDEQTPSSPTNVPPSWLTPPTGNPLKTAFALKAVDLAAVATGAEGTGVAAPRPNAPAATPLPSPAVEAQAPAKTPLTVPQVPLATPPPRTGTSCAKCGTSLAADDKFCRNCGTRVGEMPAPPASTSGRPMTTQQISAVKMPGPALPSPMLPQGATMIMPQMNAAQLGGAAATGASSTAASSGASGPSATMFFGAVTAERSAKLVLVRGQSQFGSQWRLQAGDTVVGRSDGMVLFPDDDTLAARHCRLSFRGNDLWLLPEDTQNGVFVRLRDPVQVTAGDEVVVGAQRLRVLADADRPLALRSDDDTRVLGSLVKPAPPIALLRIATEPALNEVYYRCQRLLTIGRNNCDLNFPRDSFVSERHAQFTMDGGALVLEDLRSRNGTYFRARQATKLVHGDLVLLGDKVLRVELPR